MILTVGMSVLFVGLLLKNWSSVAIGAAIIGAGMMFWLWPRRELREREPAAEVARG